MELTAETEQPAGPSAEAPVAPIEGVRVALVHDWLTGRRGAEKVLDALLDLLPEADIFTLVHRRGAVPEVERRPIRASYLSRLPAAHRTFQAFFPLFNHAARSLPLGGYDLVVSVSHCAAKNVRVPGGIPHLCYCQTPARYAWDLFDLYLEQALGRAGARAVRRPARRVRDRWRRQDRAGAASVTRFVAISRFVEERIRRIYDREAEVIHPPVDTAAFAGGNGTGAAPPGERFLVVSAVRPNKRVEEVVEAFAALGLPLDVAGAGSPRALARLRAAGGAAVRVHGEVDDATLRRLVRGCRALVHAATEDFGLAPVEAMAAGRPVIGYRPCGVAESVVDRGPERTGLLFDDPTPAGIAAAVRAFLEIEDAIDPAACRARAARFATPRFHRAFGAALRRTLAEA